MALRSSHLWRSRGIYLSVGILLLLRIILLSPWKDLLDVCVVDRAVDSLPPVNTFLLPLRDTVLHNLTVLLLWLLLGVFVITFPHKTAGIFLVSFTSIWFHLTYWFLVLLKGWLDDASCSFGRFLGQPNSISGHYCYFMFCFLGLNTLSRIRQQFDEKIVTTKTVKVSFFAKVQPLLANYLYYAFVIGAVTTVYRTLLHGYHSLRQVLYGVFLGVSSHAVMETVVFDLLMKPRGTCYVLWILFVLSPLLLFFSTLFWPFPVFGYPIGTTQVLGHGLNWFVLLVTRKAWIQYVRHYHSTEKRQSVRHHRKHVNDKIHL
eukprot:jgi/Galph1/157/GphlegSOOS_G5000.1